MWLLNFNVIIVLFISASFVIFSINLSNAQEDEFENLFIRLEFSPPVVEKGNAVHQIGYVMVVDANGSPVLAPDDLRIQLTTSNPTVASVPSEVVIPVNKGYVSFGVKVSEAEGIAEITAIFQGQELTKPFRVGGINVEVPLNVELNINIPSERMHIGTEMPVSVFLENEGTILQAPQDIQVKFEYEKSLFSMDKDESVIKKGDYYTTVILRTLQETGSGFIKATTIEPSLDSFKSISVTSSLPAKLQVHVFPNKLIQKVDRELDIFVSLLDSDGNPVVATKDIEFELFSDATDIDDELDNDFKFQKPKIRKGDWGFYHRQDGFTLDNENPKNIIGAVSPEFGLAEAEFAILTTLEEDDFRAENKTLNIYTIPKMPPEAISIVTYQVAALKGDDDDQAVIDALVEAGTIDFHPFDDEDFYEEGDTYPIEMDFDDFDSFELRGLITSSNPELVQVLDSGKVSPERSFGTAIIKSGKKEGTGIEISAAIKRVATGAGTVEVFNPTSPDKTEIFSPAGDRIVFNNEGIADLYAVLLDSKNRPTTAATTGYIVFPVNRLVEIPNQQTFVNVPIKSSLFARQLESGIANVTWNPVGVDADSSLRATQLFPIAPSSSTTKIFLPFTKIVGGDNTHQFGIVQLSDFFDNPVQVTSDLKIELKANDTKTVEIPSSVTIPSGHSFTTFPITTFGDSGTVSLSASAKGFFGSEAILEQVPFIKELVIFPTGPLGAVNIGEGVEIQIFVDDENAIPVEGVTLEFSPSGNSTVFPQTVITDIKGEATVLFTPKEGPTSSLEIFASKQGYVDDQTTIDVSVAGFEEEGPSTIFGIDPLILYAAIGGAIAAGGGIAFKLLRKPKVVTEEELEEEEI